MLVCLHMYKRPELLWTPGSSQTRPRSLSWIFFEVLLLLYTMQGDLVPVVLISQLSTPLGDKWSETVAHIWKSPKPVSHQCYQRASTGASGSLNICVHVCAVYGQICFLMPWKQHYSSTDGVGMPTWAGGSHAAPLCLFFRSTLSS